MPIFRFSMNPSEQYVHNVFLFSEGMVLAAKLDA